MDINIKDPISAGIDAAKELGGKLLDHFLPDPVAADKAKLELERMAEDGRLKRMVDETERFKTEVADRQSAREREAKIATSADAPTLNKVVLPILALAVVVLTFLLFGFLLLGSDPIEPNRKDIIIFVCGALVGLASTVINYYFGSSSSSVQKTEAMEQLLRK